jgi:hypothetical protein
MTTSIDLSGEDDVYANIRRECQSICYSGKSTS